MGRHDKEWNLHSQRGNYMHGRRYSDWNNRKQNLHSNIDIKPRKQEKPVYEPKKVQQIQQHQESPLTSAIKG